MSDAFDPHDKWLAIPPKAQPPYDDHLSCKIVHCTQQIDKPTTP